jgi:GT2 family glycosyltransferase
MHSIMVDRVAVIVVNKNGRHHLTECFQSLVAQTYSNIEIILVDNNSTDDSVAYVQAHFPQVRIICQETNLGFAAGNNIGIQATESPWIATLNNDTKVDPNWLTELVQVAQSDERVGMCASKMLFYDRPHLINSAGICVDRAGIAWDRRGGESNDETEEAAVPVFGPSAGAALYRRSMLDEIGLFDEEYFAYLEDVDLAWRARLAGWRCLYVSTAVVHHRHSATSIEGSPFKSRMLARNKLWTILKNYPWPALLFYLPLILTYDLGSVCISLVQRRDANPLRGRLMSLSQLGTVLRKRATIQRQRKISSADLLNLMEPLSNPWRVYGRYQHLQPGPRV